MPTTNPRRVRCPIHGAEHEYTDDEVQKLLLFMQVEDWEDGPRCLREILDEDPDADPFGGHYASEWRRPAQQ